MTAPAPQPGTIHGLGLGPGDPDLMSVRADRLVRSTRHVAYFRKAGRPGHARTLVNGLLHAQALEYPMDYPVTTEIPLSDPAYAATLAPFYDRCAAHLRALAEAGHDVAVLCEGDPFFYGSFMHLWSRLAPHVPVRVVPGITGMSAAWTASAQPITWGDDILTVLPATLPEDDLAARAAAADAVVVMKIGRNLPKLQRAFATAGVLDRAVLVIEAAMPGQRLIPLAQARAPVPYFSIALVHGRGRRP
jgi:precorrin-2/cobalt-factor-2 C20-methyltransferase